MRALRTLRRSAGAVAFAALGSLAGCEPQANRPDPAAATSRDAEPTGNPFADVTIDEEARKQSKQRNPFEGSLEERSVWKRALATVAEAEQHFTAAQQAHQDGDRAQLNAEGKLARTLFDRALEDTAGFEEELITQHGEDDPTVKGILKIRNTWFDRTRWLHKSIAR